MTADGREPKRPCRKRCRRINEPGHAHALTFCCFRWQTFLSRERTCRWMIEAIDRARNRHRFHLWAYVLMPEHIHLLILPTAPSYDISAILSSIKQPVARRAVRFVHRHAPAFLVRMADRLPNGVLAFRFWQRGGGYDRNLWELRYVWEMIDYSHANPVRRGLCHRLEEWPWSSAPSFLEQVLSCSFGRWPELNDHLLNSVLIGLVLALDGRSDPPVRRLRGRVLPVGWRGLGSLTSGLSQSLPSQCIVSPVRSSDGLRVTIRSA